MEDIKELARAAKQRLKSSFWEERRENLGKTADYAREMGLNENKLRSAIARRVKSEVRGEKEDEFYLKVKALLDSEGEVSDAIGRLTDTEYYAQLGYEEKQRYNLNLSAEYLKALERYKREKAGGL